MKAIKEILNGKGLPRRGEKGFTLVELLIVLAILAVLAAVVIPNVTGMFGRGAEQAYDTDLETIQMACATFFFDIHDGYDAATFTWQDSSGAEGHWYPNRYGDDTYDNTAGHGLTLELDNAATDDPNNDGNWLVCIEDGTTGAADTQIAAAAIWMGLLVNTDKTTGGGIDGNPTTERATVGVLGGEKGPYLNEITQSAGANNGGTGTYTWVIGKDGKVYGVYSTAADTWYCGFNGSYP
jgi:prepilin-type N-terminal cleavage/methylation domain-containing protein